MSDPTSTFLAKKLAMQALRTDLASSPVTVRERNPIERQRAADGTPITTNGRMCRKPEGARLYLAKGSLLAEVPDMRFQPTKQDPPAFDLSPNEVVKSYLLSNKSRDTE